MGKEAFENFRAELFDADFDNCFHEREVGVARLLLALRKLFALLLKHVEICVFCVFGVAFGSLPAPLRGAFEIAEGRLASTARMEAVRIEDELTAALEQECGRGKRYRAPGPVRTRRNLLRDLLKRSRLETDLRRATGLTPVEFRNLYCRLLRDENASLTKMSPGDGQFWLYLFLYRLRSGIGLHHLDMHCGYGASTISSRFNSILDDLVNWVDRDQMIRWPSAEERRQYGTMVPNPTLHLNTEDRFAPCKRMTSGNYQDCVGMLDGVCFRIPKYKGRDDYYVNRKRCHAVNVLAVCDPYGYITYAEPAFMVHHDRTAYVHSALYTQEREMFSTTEYLLADGGFYGDGKIVHPLKKPELELLNKQSTSKYHKAHAAPTPPIRDGRRHFNTRVKWLRAQIEHVFGIIKGTYRALLHEVSIVKGPERVWALGKVAFGLYNLQRQHRGPIRPDSYWAMQRHVLWKDTIQELENHTVLTRPE